MVLIWGPLEDEMEKVSVWSSEHALCVPACAYAMRHPENLDMPR